MSSSYTVRLSDTSRIASFRSVSGYKPHTFSCYEHFVGILNDLQMRGYRFQ